MHRNTFWIPSLIILLLASLSACASPKIEWRTISASCITLEYEPENETLARKLLPQLPALTNSIGAMHDHSFGKGLDLTSSKRAEILQFIARQIGLDKPGKQMIRIFDLTLAKQRQVVSSYNEMHQFRLWPHTTLVQALRRGESVPGFDYDPTCDDFRRNSSFSIDSTNVDNLCPFPLVCTTGESVYDVIQNSTQELLTLGTLLQPYTTPVITFHEAAEAGIVGDIGLQTAFRRWFCDGAAQWIAESATKEFIGQSEYDTAFAAFNGEWVKAKHPNVDLLGWRGVEYEASMPNCPGLRENGAHYTCAVQEIRGLAQRHGPDVLSKVIKTLAKLPAKKRHSQAILNAIKSATGEDMAVLLSGYGAETQDPFRGLAIVGLKATWLVDNKPVPVKPGATIQLDGKQDVEIEFYYELLDKEYNIHVVSKGPSEIPSISIDLKGKGLQKIHKRLGFPKLANTLKPGDYQLNLIINNALFAEVYLTLAKGAKTSNIP